MNPAIGRLRNANVLLITSDEQRFDAVGCNGNGHVLTPHLDQLAARGVRFTDHTTSCPLCTPARASILTGQYPRTHGAWSVGVKLDEQARGLSHWLAEEGYRTGFFGKAHFEGELTEYMLRPDRSKPYYGFQDFHITEDHNIGEYMDWIRREHPQHVQAARYNTHDDPEVRDAPLPPAKDGGLSSCFLSTLPENLHQTAWIADRTIDFMNKPESARPFFAWCSFVDPHHPFNPPEEFARLYDPATLPPPLGGIEEHAVRTNDYCCPEGISPQGYQQMKAYYYAMVTHIDAHVGRITQALERAGQLDNTIILYTSDHGDYLGDHGLVRKGPYLYESTLRVPLIVHLPGGLGAGRCCSNMTQHEDLAPTILELLGLAKPPSVQGQSFAGAMWGQPDAPARHWAYHTLPWAPGEGCVAVRNATHKLVHHPGAWGWRLFDLENDPQERGLSLDDPMAASIAAPLKERLLQWFLDTPPYRSPQITRW